MHLSRCFVLALLGVFALAGCASPQTPPIAPQAPQPVEIDAQDLELVRDAIGHVPTPPSEPRLAFMPKEELVNVAPLFHGTETKLLDEQHRKARIAVVGAAEVVGPDRVGKYVSDALLLEFQKRGLGANLVDREYADFYLKEVDRLESGHVKAGDKEKRIGEIFACDYIVFLHLVKDNSATAKPELLRLPLRVDPADWAAYRAAGDEYRKAYLAYLKRVEAYNDAFAAKVDEIAEKLAEVDRAWRAYDGEFSTYESRYDGYAQFQRVHGFYLAPRAAREDVLRYRIRAKEAPQKSSEERLKDEVRGILAALNLKVAIPAVEGKVYKSPEEFIPRDTSQFFYGTIHQFGVSVRVVDAPSSKVVWFGTAESQNLSHLEAVRGACRAIVDHVAE